MGTTPTPTTTASAATAATPSVGWSYRALTVAIAAATIVLTAWAAAQARTVDAQLDRVAQTIRPSIRQVAHAQEQQDAAIEAAERHDAARFSNLADSSGARALDETDLLRIEWVDLHRFRNQAPESALPALDAEIDRVRRALDDAQSTS